MVTINHPHTGSAAPTAGTSDSPSPDPIFSEEKSGIPELETSAIPELETSGIPLPAKSGMSELVVVAMPPKSSMPALAVDAMSPMSCIPLLVGVPMFPISDISGSVEPASSEVPLMIPKSGIPEMAEVAELVKSGIPEPVKSPSPLFMSELSLVLDS
jgi:hypothetical protein